MMNLLKIIQFLILISFITLFFNCQPSNFIKNKFEITGCKAEKIDSLKVRLIFDIKYYSDSTKESLFPASREKGLDGSDSKIVFLGYVNGDRESKGNLCDSYTPKGFISDFNLKKRNFIGERLEKGINICINQQRKNLILVLENKGLVDTIKISNQMARK